MQEKTSTMTAFVLQDDLEGIAATVRAGFDIHSELRPQKSALHLAASSSGIETCRLLLQLGADPNLSFGTTVIGEPYYPLHIAAEGQRPELVRMLLEAGANPNARALNDVTPLHILLERITKHESWITMARMMLEHGADPNAKSTGFVLLQRQMEFEKVFGDRHAVMVLTPLHCALFMSKSIDENFRVAAKIGGYTGAHMIAALLEHGADPSFMPENPPKRYLTPLQLATKIGTADDFQKLMGSDKAKPEQKTIAGRSLRQLTGRPEIQAILRADKTTKLISDSIDVEPSKAVGKSKGMSPL